MSILVFGKTGQVATELARFDGVTCLGREEADLSNPEACAEVIRTHAPDAVINAAAYTAVDRAEEEEALATRINAEAPAAMAKACRALMIPFVHISTDYVFDGQGDAPFGVDHATAPQNAYGRSKLAGEEAIAEIGGIYAILRTSWVFSAHGANFVKTMLRLSETRDALNVVDDQIGGPTPAGAIAAATVSIAAQLGADISKKGIYHFSGSPDVSWADFARAIFAQAGRDVVVTGIPTADYPTPATRPLNSRLDCMATEQKFGIARPDWSAALKDIVGES